jgi:hypothetical protein
MRHGFQPDAGSQVVKALAYQAERRGRFTVRGRMSWTRRGYTIIAAIIADIASLRRLSCSRRPKWRPDKSGQPRT